MACHLPAVCAAVLAPGDLNVADSGAAKTVISADTAALQEDSASPDIAADTNESTKDTVQSAQKHSLCLDAMRLVQIMTSFQQLIVAMTTSSRTLNDTQARMSELVSRADELVCSAAAVPKTDILPIFHQVGQLFQVWL